LQVVCVYNYGMIIMCLDYGDRYIGIALTDPDGRIALRHGMIDQKDEEALEKVPEIVAAEGVEKILVGVPLGLGGDETPQTHKTLAFMDGLRGVVKVDVDGVDEVFTSKEARRLLRAEGGRLDEEHSEAARLMLEHYLKQGLER